MRGINNKVAIVGMGCTRFGELWDKGVSDLIVEAAYEAFEDSGIEPKDIQAAWLGTVQSGLTGISLSGALKLQYVPITRVENMCCTATEALRAAAYAVAAGVYDLVLAVGVEKLKDTGWMGVQGANIIGESSIGIAGAKPEYSPPEMFARLAVKYFDRYHIDPDEGKRLLAKIIVKNHHNGSLNPKAHFQREVSEEDVIKSPIVAYPLGILDCCGVSDGAAAAVLTRADMARSFRDDPIYIKALSLSTGAYQHLRQDYDYTHVEENVRASKMAYEEAGIKNPREEISLAEVHDCFSIHEMLIYEDLGWSPRGQSKEDIEAGTFTLEGQLPVNTDGGLKSFGHPLGASGLRMMYEVYKQLQGKAGARQVKNARLGLTHNLGGVVPGASVAACSVVGNGRG
jgi:acetyl-CoA C-acetyltransferase